MESMGKRLVKMFRSDSLSFDAHFKVINLRTQDSDVVGLIPGSRTAVLEEHNVGDK